MAIDDFFYTYFVNPIHTGEGYNIFNTTAYAIILLVCLYCLYKIFKKIGFKWDSRAFLSLTPYIATISFARVLTDAGIWKRGFWTTTPGIDFLVLIPAFAFLLILYVFLKKKYFKPFFFSGIAVCLIPLFFQHYVNFMGLLLIMIYFSISVIPVILLRNKIPFLKNKFNFLIMISHLFDASATSVSIRFFDYFEQHVFPSLLIPIFGPEIMFVLKYVFVGLTLYLLGNEKTEISDFVRAVILFLGLGPGLRDTLRLICLV